METWREVFIVLAGAGAVLLLAVVIALTESLTVSRRKTERLHHMVSSLEGLDLDWG